MDSDFCKYELFLSNNSIGRLSNSRCLKHGIGASENFTTTLTRAAMGPIGADLIQNTNVTTEERQNQDRSGSITSVSEPPQRNSAPRILLKISRAVKVDFMTTK